MTMIMVMMNDDNDEHYDYYFSQRLKNRKAKNKS